MVPSEPIREQTLKALRIKPHVLNSSKAIIVATMQAFKQEDVDRLSVYKQNTDMMPHFENVRDPAARGNLSLVDALVDALQHLLPSWRGIC